VNILAANAFEVPTTLPARSLRDLLTTIAVGEGVLLVDSTHGVVVVAAPSEPGPNLAYYVNATQYSGSDQVGTGTLTKQ